MTTQEFFTKYNNKGIDYDGYYGFQCMDLAHQYAVEVNGQDIPAAPAAKDVWGKATPGYEKIANTPTGVPQKGDIIIWGVGIGPYGHIAVFNEGNANSFTSFDQNWPINSLCHFQNHNYNGVVGWLRSTAVQAPPPAPTPVITDQTLIPLNLVTAEEVYGELELGTLKSKLIAKDQYINDMESKVAEINADAQKVVNDFNAFKNIAFVPESSTQKFLVDLARKLG
jgi:hypothetical protein